jgi:uncharacterized protein (TIGR00369 family)
MDNKFKTSDFMKVIHAGGKPPNCDETLNIKINTAQDGVAQCTWVVDERYLNGVGVVMGGFISSAADIAMAYAISTLLEENQSFASINLNTTFHRPLFVGGVHVEARVEKKGKKIVYLICEIVQNGKKVANVDSSVIVLEN